MKKRMAKEEEKNDDPIEPDPPIKSRFLPGEVDSVVDRIDFKSYKKHRLNCAHVKPKVDNKAPKFDLSIYYDTEKLKVDSRLTHVVHGQNLQLAKKLNKVYRLGGKVDCWNLTDKKYRTDQTQDLHVLRRITRDNKKLFCSVNCRSGPGELAPQTHAKAWRVLRAQIEEKQRFPWPKWPIRYPSIARFAEVTALPENVDEEGVPRQRTMCYFDLASGPGPNKLPLGRVVFELYNDYVPAICANFEAFCRGHEGMSYKGTPFHRIVSGYWCQGGDVTKFNGLGGASIYEDESPEEENFTLRHACPGVLSTYNDRRDGFDSKFNLSFRPLRTMDARKIVFGKVVKGMDNVLKIDAYGTRFGKPLREITVGQCGVLPPRKTKKPQPSIRSASTGNSEHDDAPANE